ncbi:TPA: RHS repeat-associated core domain-containing protein, partial [Serratia marcescens]
GRRSRKAVRYKGKTEQTTRFLWQGYRLLQEQRDDGSRRSWSYDPASPWSPLAALEQAGDSSSADIYWYHTDLNSAPLEVTDAAGSLCWSGQYQDDESGLHYNLFRYYEPEVGRFTTQDPIGLEGGLNLYAYGPNPLTWIDPFGLSNCSTLDRIIGDANKVASRGGAITAKQAQILRDNLPVVQRRSVFQNQMARKEFVRDQHYLMSQWEANTGRAWPTGATPHHIIPLESGGANKWWNLMPTHGTLPNHSLPGVPGPHAAGGVLRTTVQQSRKALPPGTITDLRL